MQCHQGEYDVTGNYPLLTFNKITAVYNDIIIGITLQRYVLRSDHGSNGRDNKCVKVTVPTPVCLIAFRHDELTFRHYDRCKRTCFTIAQGRIIIEEVEVCSQIIFNSLANNKILLQFANKSKLKT